MARCCACRGEADTVWQPFGPAPACDEPDAFSFPGWHYRGFPALRVCTGCSQHLMRHSEDLAFSHKGQPYVYAAALREISRAPF